MDHSPPPNPMLARRLSRSVHGTILLGLTLAGCALGPNYQRPETPVTPEFRGPVQPGTHSIADLPWWTLFQDPDLLVLIG